MTDQSNDKATQRQDSRQSGKQGEAKHKARKVEDKTRSGIGSSQAQDTSSSEQRSERPSAGTADIERGGPQDRSSGNSGSTESLVDDPVGAFKERP